jgi:CheY-like chemotaxis protein
MASILMVDDEEMDRILPRSVLEDAGHEVLYAPNGGVALRIYQARQVDLVVTDLAMPEVDGLLLIRKLRERDPGVRIMAISGGSRDKLERAEALGAVATLAKPYTPAQLLEGIRTALAPAPPPTDLWK